MQQSNLHCLTCNKNIYLFITWKMNHFQKMSLLTNTAIRYQVKNWLTVAFLIAAATGRVFAWQKTDAAMTQKDTMWKICITEQTFRLKKQKLDWLGFVWTRNNYYEINWHMVQIQKQVFMWWFSWNRIWACHNYGGIIEPIWPILCLAAATMEI